MFDFLIELLNTKIESTVEEDTDDTYRVRAKIGNRTVEFLATIFSSSNKFRWYVEFSEIYTDHRGNEQPNYKKTGSGAEFQVAAFVTDTLVQFVQKKNPTVIYFSASKEDHSRADVYERVVKKKLPQFEVIKDTEGRETKFTLVRKDQVEN